MSLYKLYNHQHFGDCFYTLQYARKLCLANPEAEVHFFTRQNRTELMAFLEPALRMRIQILPHTALLNEAEAHDCWIGREDKRWLNKQPAPWMWDTMQYEFARYLSEQMQVPCPYKSVRDVLFDSPQFELETPLSKPVDYLIINGTPRSGQFRYNGREFEELITHLHQQGASVVTTEQVSRDDVPCTRSYGINMVGIGNIASYARNIIGVLTGPLHPCFNAWTIDKVERWMVLSSGESLTWNNRISQHTSVRAAQQHL